MLAGGASATGKRVHHPPIIDRGLGCLLGLAIGNALGTAPEFTPRDSRLPVVDMIGGGPFGLQPGEWTDETSMALCLTDSLIVCGELDVRPWPTGSAPARRAWHHWSS
jgi:ADP-ribosyl-[dinitrogen reductase] hydrolase